MVTVVAAAAAETAVAATAGEGEGGTGSESRFFLLHHVQTLISEQSSSHQPITAVDGLRLILFWMKRRNTASQILAMSSSQIPVKAIQGA